MEQVTEEEQARLQKLLRKHRKRLLSLPNVHSVDVGFEFSDGEPSGRLALRVHVTEKVPTAKLKRAQRVPDELDGVPVDVIHFNPEPHLTRRELHDPVMGGVRIRNTSRTTSGTLGMIVLDSNDLRPLALSNEHVMLRRPPERGDVISQPGPNTTPDILGTVVRFDRTLDCAVCGIGARTHTFEIYGVGAVTGWRPALIGMKVYKSGLSSGVTWGIVDGVSSSGFTVVPDTSIPSNGQMSLPGDSGSIWMELTSNKAVGLHFAGNGPTDPNERASSKHIGHVLGKLEILIFDGAAVGRAWIGGGCKVLARATPFANCNLRVVYPSGRPSSAKGLGRKKANGDGWVEWSWMIGTHTKRVGAGTGAPLGKPMKVFVTLGGRERVLERPLEGETRTD